MDGYLLKLSDPKECTECLVEKPLDSFTFNKGCKDGFSTVCKVCIAEYGRAYRKGIRKENRRCVNPDHLILGTHQDNAQDAIRDGIMNYSSKLNEIDVKAIRNRVSQGESQVSLAQEFNVSKSTISKIVQRVNWKSI